MFASVSRCAEPISQPCQLKVKVIDHGFELWISCLLHISFSPGRISFKLWSYVCLSETMCRNHNLTMPTQGQSHNSRSQVWALNFTSALYPIPVEGFSLNFGQMFTLVRRCAESITQPCRQGQGHSSRSWVWSLNFMSTLYFLYTWEDFL